MKYEEKKLEYIYPTNTIEAFCRRHPEDSNSVFSSEKGRGISVDLEKASERGICVIVRNQRRKITEEEDEEEEEE